ncbi:DinB family protein [Pseudomonas sp. 2FG]|uniref:DinB family protein n=1 Tax=Pseudomonas sp. 2FG TaxID=2502191 RepID=UPI0010F50C9B|nr:DinB family protein [Pseudomonas sp. 2FG]
MPNAVTSPRARLLASQLERLLAYHGWAYNRLLASLEALDEDGYRAPCGLFFGSVHGTLNHLAVADRIWLARVRREPPPFTRLDAEAVSERSALAGFLADGVHAWRALLSEQDDQSLGVPLAYQNMRGEPQLKPLADIVLHLVNHGTHHRGQISAALTAFGQPAPVLDYLYFLPETL